MVSSLFYLQVEKDDDNKNFLNEMEQLASDSKRQIYVVDKPLGDSKYSYGYDKAVVVLCPDHKISFLNYGEDNDKFGEFVEDFLEDLGSISDKYRYKEKIGRPRQWRNDIVETCNVEHVGDWEEFFQRIHLDDGRDRKKSELLISLLTGSINDVEKVQVDVSENILDSVKQRILLFDGDQTRFIYQKPQKKTINIQGLSGTGKTELLLHKLKELYLDNGLSDSKIMFTCHNKILADSLRDRIPDFFDFMKVDQQILWNQRLWCVNAWGSQSDKNSGAYSHICSFYGATFHRYSRGYSFDDACKEVLIFIKSNDSVSRKGYVFDYILIDESQDFPDSFVELCNLVTKINVYVAGDIFQSIFDEKVVSEIEPDYLLSKCYRTDPRTLMFAHALGMGLFENPKLRWLEDREWIACGYEPEKIDGRYKLSREPIRRFSDVVDQDYASVEIVRVSAGRGETSESKIIEVIEKIREENPSVTANDIGVIFIDSQNYVYNSADNLFFSVKQKFNWDVNKAYETKNKVEDHLFISNKNNVKGLEFPFVICITKRISDSQSYRNALYMMLTRSFLTSYLLVSDEINAKLLESIESGLTEINLSGCLVIDEPTRAEIEHIKTTINYTDVSKSLYDSVYDLFDEMKVPVERRSDFYRIIQASVGDVFEKDRVEKIIDFNMKL